jgi:glycosyltransferase involved in cell wall biosynthesis
MNLVCVLPRFGAHILGGAEVFTSRLLSEMARRGHHVTVLTTTAERIHVGPGYSICWSGGESGESHPRREERAGIRIERFPVGPPSPWDEVAALTLAPFAAWRRRCFDARLRGSRIWREGWLGPELLHSGASVVWSSGTSRIRLPAPAESLSLEVLAPRSARIQWRAGTCSSASRRLQPWTWERLRVETDGVSEVELRLMGRPRRGRAFAVRHLRGFGADGPVVWLNGDGRVDRDAALFARDTLSRGERRLSLEELASRRGRGPISPALLRRLGEIARDSDAVVAGYLPFALPFEALRVTRAAGRPFLLLPFAHANDPSHHYRWIYRLLRDSDRVLAATTFNREHFFEPLGARAAFLGGGPSHTCEAAASPAAICAFRQRHGIAEGTIVVLGVGRKTAYKGYREVTAAVDNANQRGLSCVHLWAGPDEDGRPVESASWRYAGPLSDAELCMAYAASQVFCLFSAHESFGSVVLDAFVHALPVVVDRLCGPTSELVGADAGLAVAGSQLPDVLARLASNAQLRRRLGEAGRARLDRHRWADVATRLEAVLGEVQRP